VHWAPGIPHALCWAEIKCTTRTQCAARMRLLVIARSNATKQSSFLLRAQRKLDCFASLAMTIIGCLKIESQLSSPDIAVRRTASLPLAYDRAIQYSRDVSDRTEKPRRTGFPAGACHPAGQWPDRVAGDDDHWWDGAVGSLRPYATAHEAGTTGRPSIKSMKMMDRPLAVSHIEAIGGGDGSTDPGLGVANSGFQLLAFGKAGCDGRR
jgi:hypothetical protein